MSSEECVFDFNVQDLDGNDVSLDIYRKHVLMIVNTASKGTNKKQLEGLNKLQEIFRNRPFAILAFPCRQFLNQEKSTNEKIKQFYVNSKRYSFETFGAVKVNGKNASPLFKWLKHEKQGPMGKNISWNFTKFLIESDGKTIKRFENTVSWAHLAWKIELAIRNCEAQHEQAGEPQPIVPINVIGFREIEIFDESERNRYLPEIDAALRAIDPEEVFPIEQIVEDVDNPLLYEMRAQDDVGSEVYQSEIDELKKTQDELLLIDNEIIEREEQAALLPMDRERERSPIPESEEIAAKPVQREAREPHVTEISQ